MNRRQLLKLAGAGALTLTARPLVGMLEGTARAASPPGPKFFLQIIPSGGIDAVYGADPKTARDVERGIDVPYPAGRIVTTRQAPLGPAFAPLAPWMPRLAIVNSFRQNSANHQSGLVHTTCCRATSVSGTPTLLDVLGARRTDGAVGAITIGTAFAAAFSPRYLGEPTTVQFGDKPGLLEHLDQLDPHELGQAAVALRREAGALAATAAPGSQADVTAGNLRESAALLDGWAASPKFAPPAWPIPYEDDEKTGRDLERALWLFENRLARCVTVSVTGQDFDTHIWNGIWQPRLGGYLAGLLDRLFHELDRRKVDGQPMSQQTAVFVGSEIRPVPAAQRGHGKDHFPQVSYLFFGPWFATGQTYGGTDRQMVARPVVAGDRAAARPAATADRRRHRHHAAPARRRQPRAVRVLGLAPGLPGGAMMRAMLPGAALAAVRIAALRRSHPAPGARGRCLPARRTACAGTRTTTPAPAHPGDARDHAARAAGRRARRGPGARSPRAS